MKLRLIWKLCFSYLFLILIGQLVVGGYLYHQESRAYEEQVAIRLETMGRMLLREIPVNSPPPWDDWAKEISSQQEDTRITVIDGQGRVWADSHEPAAKMENHLNRPEVQIALKGQRGQSRRRSTTIRQDLLYVALPLAKVGHQSLIIRLSLPLEKVDLGALFIRKQILFISFLALVLSLALGYVLSHSLSRRVEAMARFALKVGKGQPAEPLRDPSGDELGDLSRSLNQMAQEIQKHLEALSAQEGQLRAILESMEEGVLVVAPQGHIALANPAVSKIFSLGEIGLEGRKPLEIFRQPELHQLIDRVQKSGEPKSLELTNPYPPAKTFWVSGVALPVSATQRGVILVYHDITELKRLEEARKELVANVSHELRSPLTAMKGFVENLQEPGLVESERQRFLEIVEKNLRRMERLLADLLYLSNLELGRVELTLRPLSLTEIADEVFSTFQEEAKKKNITMENNLSSSLPPLRADHDRLSQILVNLLDNALKYTPEGGKVWLEAQLMEGGRLQIIVGDTGIGIPPAHLPRLFERFYRVDKARSRELGGTGLGLAIVKHLVLAHGGTVSVESKPGIGSRFFFTLPTAS